MEDGIKGSKAFMSVVCVATESPNTRLVRWRIGIKTPTGALETHKQGMITVALPSLEGSQGDQVAELAALHELLVLKEILGQARRGNGLIIHTSHGAIRKMTLWHKQGRSKPFSSGYLVPYGRYLFGRFADAEIAVSKDVSWVQDVITSPKLVTEITVKDRLPDFVHAGNGLGLVEITTHAIERVCQRNNGWDYPEAWRFIVNQLRGTSMYLITPELAKIQRIKSSYANGERWFNPAEGWVFAFSKEGDHQVLSTMMVAERD
ncbi:hypothetical protein [Methylophilus sp. QUAN]|uniref:hypothetical protein n=1 Tax=Methylophilus sp. QUAN TaxID=2781020 RepID=UPI001890A8E7|nr:hypothetical protein [Methylophilus sp. QUAN]MBF4991054.1 hypothetical protein [Methylophilus sp. QUAN]